MRDCCMQCVIHDENNDTHILTVCVYSVTVYDNYSEDDNYDKHILYNT